MVSLPSVASCCAGCPIRSAQPFQTAQQERGDSFVVPTFLSRILKFLPSAVIANSVWMSFMFALETLTDSTVVTNLLDSLSGLSTLLIVGLFAMHLFAFFVLWIW